MNVVATGIPVLRANARTAFAARPRTAPFPASAIGCAAWRMSSAARAMSAEEASGCTGSVRASGSPCVSAAITSSGSSYVGGSRLLGLGDLEGLADDLGDDRRVAHTRVPLGDRAHDRQDVDVLVGLLVHPFQVALAGEDDDRGAIEERVGDPRHEVRRAGPQGRETDARPTGEAAVGVGHVRGRLLVPRRNEADGRARQRLVEVDGLLSGHAEHVRDALGLQAGDEEIGGLSTGHVGPSLSGRSWDPTLAYSDP